MQSDKPLINEQIKHKSLLVINHDGKNLGVIPLTKALQLAQAEELDLVLINDSDDARKPAVAKIIDCGKYLYNLKIKQSNSKQKTLKQKEIAVKPQIGFNDLSTNAKKAIGWINDGHQVLLKIKSFGRVGFMPELIQKVYDDFTQLISSDARVIIPLKKLSPVLYTATFGRNK